MATAPKASPLPESVTRHAESQAAKAGLTSEQWLAQMAALRLDTDDGARDFFRERSRNRKPEAWRAALAARPHSTPESGDELPE